MGERAAFLALVFTVVVSFCSAAGNTPRRVECLWPLVLEGTSLRHPNLPGVTHDQKFLRSAKFGFFNTSKTSYEELFPFDDRFIETLVMGNILYEKDPHKVFGRRGDADATWDASLKLLNFVTAKLASHSDGQVAALYSREDRRLRCHPIGKSFSLDNPREHPLAILGRVLPDDVLLVELERQPTMIGGFVAFPSNWSLRGNLGLTLGQIHAYVHEDEEGELKEKYRKQIEAMQRLFGPETLGIPRVRNNWFVYSDPRVAQYP
ncbi:MAG: DUF3445 domain-containing protein, partial [Bdellovibrionales bacterium]|nr:DUF3445 domain-containing protein [Bdellovibrionales bacterium]